jgi:hypothetical protein
VLLEVLNSKVLDAIVHGKQCVRCRSIDLQLIVQLEQHSARLKCCRPINQHPDERFLLECRAFPRWAKENLLVNLLDRFEEGAWMEVLALGEYARRLWPGGRWLVLGHLLGPVSAKAPPMIVLRVLWTGVHDCLAAGTCVGLANLERNQKWVSGYVGDVRTFFPGSALTSSTV